MTNEGEKGTTKLGEKDSLTPEEKESSREIFRSVLVEAIKGTIWLQHTTQSLAAIFKITVDQLHTFLNQVEEHDGVLATDALAHLALGKLNDIQSVKPFELLDMFSDSQHRDSIREKLRKAFLEAAPGSGHVFRFLYQTHSLFELIPSAEALFKAQRAWQKETGCTPAEILSLVRIMQDTATMNDVISMIATWGKMMGATNEIFGSLIALAGMSSLSLEDPFKGKASMVLHYIAEPLWGKAFNGELLSVTEIRDFLATPDISHEETTVPPAAEAAPRTPVWTRGGETLNEKAIELIRQIATSGVSSLSIDQHRAAAQALGIRLMRVRQAVGGNAQFAEAIKAYVHQIVEVLETGHGGEIPHTPNQIR